MLKPLPADPFVYAEWKVARVNIDCHFYSAPFPLVGKQVEVRLTIATVEVIHRGVRVAANVRSYDRARHTTTASTYRRPTGRISSGRRLGS